MAVLALSTVTPDSVALFCTKLVPLISVVSVRVAVDLRVIVSDPLHTPAVSVNSAIPAASIVRLQRALVGLAADMLARSQRTVVLAPRMENSKNPTATRLSAKTVEKALSSNHEDAVPVAGPI